jgi:hypothetical protein
VTDKSAEIAAKQNAAAIKKAVKTVVASKLAVKKIQDAGKTNKVAKPFSYGEHAVNKKAQPKRRGRINRAKLPAKEALLLRKAEKLAALAKKPATPAAAVKKAAQSARFQQLPVGVNGDGHDARLLSTIQEVMDLDNPSKDYKGQVDTQGRLCPGCEKIVYRADSPLSDDDVKLMRAQHADLVLGHVKLHAQSTLDRAQLMLDDAEASKKAILDRYPAKQEGGAAGYEEGGEAGKKFGSLIQFDLHN